MNNSHSQPNKNHAIHDPYTVNKGMLVNSIIFFGVVLLLSLIVVSFIFEVVAALQIFAISPAVTITLVLACNAFKTLVPLFIAVSKAVNPRKTVILPHLIRIMLIVFSALMTLLLLTTWLSAPNAEQIKKYDLDILKKNYQEQTELLDAKAAAKKIAINSKFEAQAELIKELAIHGSKTLTSNITTEAKNVINGISDGPRVAALERVKKADLNYAIASLDKAMEDKTSLLNKSIEKIDAERALLFKEFKLAQNSILDKNYFDDDRSKLAIILDLKRALQTFDWDMQYLSIVWLFSLLVTVMLEALIIYLSSWLANTYKQGISRYIERKEQMEEAALFNVTETTKFSAQAQQAKAEAKHSMEDIYDEMEATSKTFI